MLRLLSLQLGGLHLSCLVQPIIELIGPFRQVPRDLSLQGSEGSNDLLLDAWRKLQQRFFQAQKDATAGSLVVFIFIFFRPFSSNLTEILAKILPKDKHKQKTHTACAFWL